jgi:hypothetical protein
MFIRMACLLLFLAPACLGQVCMPPSPQPDSGYTYVRAEITALRSIRSALNESDKFEWVAPDDPQRVHKQVELYTIVNNVSDDYDCAASILQPYAKSKNENISKSAETLLLAIQGIKDVNAHLIEMMETVNKATKAEDIDQTEIAKSLADMKSVQKYVRTLVTLGVRLSIFSILQGEGGDNNWKATAFTITDAQRKVALGDASELAKGRSKEETVVDLCADFLVKMLNCPLPTATEVVAAKP